MHTNCTVNFKSTVTQNPTDQSGILMTSLLHDPMGLEIWLANVIVKALVKGGGYRCGDRGRGSGKGDQLC